MTKKRVAILASGGGSNALALMQAMAAPDFPARCVLVFSNKPQAGVLARALQFGVMSAVLDSNGRSDREEYDAQVLALLLEQKPDVVCLAGYMRILTPVLVDAFKDRLLNIHPALLPKFGGAGMYGQHVHQAVLEAGEKESGATVHLVDHGVDSGRILLQGKVAVQAGDTPQSLAARVLEVEHWIYPQALRELCEGMTR